jgi:hypothetical protein
MNALAAWIEERLRDQDLSQRDLGRKTGIALGGFLESPAAAQYLLQLARNLHPPIVKTEITVVRRQHPTDTSRVLSIRITD